MAINKVFASFDEAVADIPDGATLMIDGFAGPGGTPQNLIRALRDHGAKDLTIISNTAGLASVIGFGTIPGDRPIDIGILVDNEQINKVVASFRCRRRRRALLLMSARTARARWSLSLCRRDACGAHSHWRRGHTGVLYADRRGHAAGGGQGDARFRRQRACARICVESRLRAAAGAQGRPYGQYRVSRHIAQLQRSYGDGGADDDHGSR